MQSYIQIYTGNGKGKTTAAFGLALRAVGAGKKVFFAQFVKGKTYSEIEATRKFLPDIEIKQYGLGCFIVKEPTPDDIRAAKAGLTEVTELMHSGRYDLVVLDEANIAVFFKLFSVTELINAIQQRNTKTEVVVTGRYAAPELLEIADLITEMTEVRHYYNSGVEARKGIEF